MLKQLQVKTLELDKMLAVSKDSQKIGEFLEWLNEKDIVLAEWSEDVWNMDGEYFTINKTKEQILADYFGISLVKCEKERSALLDAVREDNS